MLKLFALSDIIKGLRKQKSPLEPWSLVAEKLPKKLMDVPLDDVLRISSLSFRKFLCGALIRPRTISLPRCKVELKMLVSTVSKTSHYHVKLYTRRQVDL